MTTEKRYDFKDFGMSQKSTIENLLQEKLEEQNLEMSERISGLHLELIRQFTSQYNTMTQTMERLAKENQKYKTELKDLREENEKLKKISY